MEDINEKLKTKSPSEVNKKLLTEDKKELQSWILKLTEEQPLKSISDKILEREREKITLLSGNIISIKEIRDVITSNLQPYSSNFTKETGFYREMYRLLGWDVKKADDFIKPHEVALYTNQLIYDRFSKEVLPTLQVLNPYIGFCIRMYRLFQYLNEDGIKQLDIFIFEAVTMMKTCTNWREFKLKYTKEYHLPIQLKIHEMID